MDYELLDSGDGRKLERFGSVVLARPCAQALWSRRLSEDVWEDADAHFTRIEGLRWETMRHIPKEWEVEIEKIRFKLKRTDFGHLGVFPEQALFWGWMQKYLAPYPRARVLNLFAYSGGSTMAAALAGAHVTHVDAAKGMVDWAHENARLNNIDKQSIAWIVDDARKYLAREIRRQEKYDAIILDPPSFGRGKSGEIFKIEKELVSLLHMCGDLLSSSPLFVLFTCHTPGVTPLVMEQLLREISPQGSIVSGEMTLEGNVDAFVVPSGNYALWTYKPLDKS
jgi:23S rRNA (cytosine1962-C5)-methyltransferase